MTEKSDDLILKIDKKIKERYGANWLMFSFNLNKNKDKNLKSNFRLLQEELSKKDWSGYKTYPEIKAWRQIFKDFNCDPNYKSSVENLTKAYKDWNFPNISPLIDYLNLISIKLTCALGVNDKDKLTKIDSEIRLRYGKDESFLDFKGKKHEATTDHIIYGIKDSVVTWLWCYRESIQFAVDKNSDNFVLIVDVLTHDKEQIRKSIIKLLEPVVENLKEHLTELV